LSVPIWSTDSTALHVAVINTVAGMREMKMLHQLNETEAEYFEIQSVIKYSKSIMATLIWDYALMVAYNLYVYLGCRPS